MKSIRTAAAVALTAALALVLVACGSSSSGGSSTTASATGNISTGGFQNPTTQSLTGGKRGGTLQVLNETDFESLDPGNAYYSIDYEVVFATQRPLYSNKPNTASEATPDMADSPVEIAPDNKTVTVHLKQGIHFSPPVNSEVTAEDVAYAIQRGANPNVANPYFQSYFEAIEGAPKATGGPIKGIQTPNTHTIVLHLTEPKGQLVADALVLPLTAAVPKQYTEKLDRHAPSEYANYQVATGPYMLKNNAEGKVLGIGYIPGQSATLVRNPNWNPKPTSGLPISTRSTSRSAGRTRSSGVRCWKARTSSRTNRRRSRASGSRLKNSSSSWRYRRAPEPTTSLSTTRSGRSRTSTCARRCGRRSTARRWTRRAAARSSPT